MFGKTASLYGVVRLACGLACGPPGGHSIKVRAAGLLEAFLL